MSASFSEDSLGLPENKKRLKELYPGRNKIYLNGIIVTSHDLWWILLTIVAITVPLSLFIVFDVHRLLEADMRWSLTIFGVLFSGSVIFLLRTAMTDPGVLPRYSSRKETLVKDNPDVVGEDGTLISSLVYHSLNPEYVTAKQVVVDGQTQILKYCYTCELFRPPRASHCHYCDNCVIEFDHHCPWVANCVGRRNYRDFVLFVGFSMLLSLATSVLLIRLLHSGPSSQFGPISIWADGGLVLYSLLATFYLACLFGYHVFLACKGLTTSEQIKRTRNTSFTLKLCLGNFKRIFWDPIPERSVDWAAYTHRKPKPEPQVMVEV